MKKWFLIFGLSLGLLGSALAQGVEVSAKVQDEQIAVGKPFVLDLMMKVPYGSYIEWNGFVTDTLSEQIDILKRGDLVRTADADSNIIVQQQLTLMTFDTGHVQIPGLQLSALDAQFSPLTSPIDLYVTTIAVDTTQTFKPLVPPIDQPVSMKEVFPWILGALLLILIGLVVWYFVKRRKTKVDENGEPVKGPVVPPYNKALDDLESLKQQKLWQIGKLKEYYSGLSDIAREYIEGQFGVNAVEMTTDEILRELSKLDFDRQIYDKIKDAMDLSDLVKFAKYSASSLENDNAMDNVEGFVKESYSHYQAMKAKEEEEARQHV